MAAPETSGLRCIDARAIDRMARREVVGAIEHDRGIFHQLVERGSVDATAHGMTSTSGLIALQRHSTGLCFRRSDALSGVQDLPLQVGEVDCIAVDQHDRCHSGRCEVVRGRRTQPTGADDEHARRAQLLLAFDADLVQQDVARIAQQLVIV